MRFQRLGQTSVWTTTENLTCRACGASNIGTDLLHIHGYGFFCFRSGENCYETALSVCLKNEERVKIRLIRSRLI